MNVKRHTILIVDDEQVIRRVLKQRLSADGYHCEEAGSAGDALAILNAGPVELVVLDIKMPGRSGIELLPEIKLKYPDIAIIMVTATNDTVVAIQCMKEGADDYLIKPFNLEEVSISVRRALERRRLELENIAYKQHLEQMVAERTKDLKQAVEEIKLASLDTVHRLARAAEHKDEDTGAHIQRVSRYSAAIARRMGLSDEEVENILYAAPMHDVGKIGIPDRILLKTGSLDAEEWEIMRQHTLIGAEILGGSKVEFIRLAEVIALTHHEKWDGSGYPRGLKGTEIPIAGRIVAIADVFDALTSHRSYKSSYRTEQALDTIKASSGTHFDPDVVDAFFAIKDEILAIERKYKDKKKDIKPQQMVAAKN
jgi:putative two-component system response regulator